MQQTGIYQILNLANGKCYVGQAGRTLRSRRQEHWRDLRHGKHDNDHLQNAWNLHGSEAFVFEVLEHVPDLAQLEEREQYWFDTLKPEYNIAPVAGSPLGVKHTEEARRNMSVAHKGKVQSEEHKQKNSASHMGKVHTEEAKRKMSEAAKGRVLGPQSEEHKQKISAAKMGRPKSAETKARMSAAQSGENNPNAELTEQGVREIKLLLQEGVLLLREIAAMYGVSRKAIGHIKRGRTWATVGAV